MNQQKQRVAVVGASANPERYSNRAVRLLREHGHEVLPVNPVASTIEGLPVFHDLGELTGHVNTVTVYVSPEKSSAFLESLVDLKPDRVIFNPGAENPDLATQLETHGIHTEEACTLVLLNTGQF